MDANAPQTQTQHPRDGLSLSAQEVLVRLQGRQFSEIQGRVELNKDGLPIGFWNPRLTLSALQSSSDDDEKPLEIDQAAPVTSLLVADNTSAKGDAPATRTAAAETPPDEAWVSLDYSEGVAILKDTGTPFWERIPDEPSDYYGAFSVFLQLNGIRTLYDLSKREEICAKGLTLRALQGISELYMWRVRCLAYDRYAAEFRRKMRAKNVEIMEDDHLELADYLADEGKKAINKAVNKDEIGAKEALDMLKFSSGLKRVALGLPANGAHANSPVQVNVDASQYITNAAQQDRRALSQALRTPETAGLLQNLALKVSGWKDNATDAQISQPQPQLLSEDEGVSEVVGNAPTTSTAKDGDQLAARRTAKGEIDFVNKSFFGVVT